MKTVIACICTLLWCCTALAEDAMRQLTDHLGTSPALVVVLCGDGEGDQATVEKLTKQTPWTIVCQGGSDGVGKIRTWARQEGLLGTRVSVIDDSLTSLWLASDMADAVWLLPSVTARPPVAEVKRILHPGGIAVASVGTFVKPAQSDTDQWRHPYHGPDNNIVSQDNVARLPGELRFQTTPVFAAMPNQTLFAGGRMFFFTGHIAFHEREEALLNKLTVLNAYNGLTLWSRPLNPNYVVHNLSKVATDSEIIYAEGGSLLVLDAATGQQQGSIPVPEDASAAGDTDWKWLAQQDGVLWAAFGPPDGRVSPHREKRKMGHWPWNVANDQYHPITQNFGSARTLAAFSYPEMDLLWSVTEPEAFDVRALCMDEGRIFQLAPQKYIAARDAATGKQLWRQTPETADDVFKAIGEALKRQGWGLGWATYCCARAGDGVVCIAGPPFKQSVCIGFEQGNLLWAAENQSPHPFFLDDALYVMPRVAQQQAVCQRVDPMSGKVLDEYKLGVIGSCTRLTVTPTQFYYRPGGGEGRTVYFDITARELANYEGVVRPGCFDGAVPANGRLYWMPLACDCWQVHGTFSMAPRVPLKDASGSPPARQWAAPTSPAPAADTDWPMFRANAAGTATTPVKVMRDVTPLWEEQLSEATLTAPICVGGRVFVGASDGSVWGLDASNGKTLWTASSRASVVHPPAYWNGRVVFGSCDGFLYNVDAESGQLLGTVQVAPEKRLVNIMNQLMSTWPLGGGVVVTSEGVAYTAAGSTATDGTIAAAVDLLSGQYRWRQAYTLDRKEPKLSFGVQSNLLLSDNKLLINGGAPVGVIALDAATGEPPEIVARLEAGMELFLEPDGKPFCTGPEIFAGESARTTIFKRHQGRAYFETSGKHIALASGRLFCARDTAVLDEIVGKLNTDPKTGAERVHTAPWDPMKVPVPDSLLWASDSADIRGMAVAADGVVVLHNDSVEAISLKGESLWSVDVPATPMRWGVALIDTLCVVTLTNGQVVALGK